MYSTYAFRAVYWGGAAYFLLADVELRRRSEGKVSLDRVLSTLRAQNEGSARTWTAEALLAELDRLGVFEVFQSLARESLARPFPDYAATLDALGVRAPFAVLDEDAPLAPIRRAIFAPRTTP